MSIHNNLRPVRIENVAVYDGKLGWFHGFATRTFTSKKTNTATCEVVGVIELENGRIIQLSTNRFVFLDPENVPVSEWAPAPADIPFKDEMENNNE